MSWLKRWFGWLKPSGVKGRVSRTETNGVKTKAGEVSAEWRFK